MTTKDKRPCESAVFMSFSVLSNLSGRVLGVLACLPADMTWHQGATFWEQTRTTLWRG